MCNTMNPQKTKNMIAIAYKFMKKIMMKMMNTQYMNLKIEKQHLKDQQRKEQNFSVDLEKRIKDLPCGLTIEEAIKVVPGYKKEFNKAFKVIKRGKEVKYMETPEKTRFTSTRGRAKIEDVEIEAIIDSGA